MTQGDWMLGCPHCNERGVNPLKKLFIGPAFEHRCTKCRKYWGVSHMAPVVSVACVLGYLAFLYTVDPTPFAAKVAGVAAFVAMAFVLLFLLPAVEK